MERELEVAKKLGLGAGRILMDYYKRDVSIDWKAPGDPVTVADREASDFIVGALKRKFDARLLGHQKLSGEKERLLLQLRTESAVVLLGEQGVREACSRR